MRASVLVGGVLVAAVLVHVAGAGTLDPSRLVLRQADVPAGYDVVADKTGIRTNAQDVRDYPELRAKYRRWGRVTGYQAQFDRALTSITSRADVLRNRAGARGMVEWFVGEAARQSQAHTPPRKVGLGDAGLLYAWRFGGDSFTIVVWRFGRVFAIVGGTGIDKQHMLALARSQQRRISAATR